MAGAGITLAGAGGQDFGGLSPPQACTVRSSVRAGAVQHTLAVLLPTAAGTLQIRRSPGAPLLGRVSGAVWLTGCHSRACCSFQTFKLWFQLFGVQRTRGYFVIWRVAIACVAETYWPILVNEKVPGHGLKRWDTVSAIADSPQHCSCQG